MYALIEFAGKQFRIEEGSSIKVPYVDGKVGTKVTIDKVLYLDDGKNKTVGTPLVSGVTIDGEITSHGRERKVVVFKFKRRKGYQKKNTHRQKYTILKMGKLGAMKKTVTSKKTTSPPTKKTVDKKEQEKKVSTPTSTKKKQVIKSRDNKKEKE